MKLHSQELQFQMAVRDQIISEQRTALSNLWTTVEAAGLGRDAVLEIAQEKGIFMEGFMPETDGPPTVGASQLTSVIKAENKKGLGVINNSMAGERAKYRCLHNSIPKSCPRSIVHALNLLGIHFS